MRLRTAWAGWGRPWADVALWTPPEIGVLKRPALDPLLLVVPLVGEKFTKRPPSAILISFSPMFVSLCTIDNTSSTFHQPLNQYTFHLRTTYKNPSIHFTNLPLEFEDNWYLCVSCQSHKKLSCAFWCTMKIKQVVKCKYQMVSCNLDSDDHLKTDKPKSDKQLGIQISKCLWKGSTLYLLQHKWAQIIWFTLNIKPFPKHVNSPTLSHPLKQKKNEIHEDIIQNDK